ncbi:hypothetical protein [Pseudomonas donghuensis]|uniref:hypothetical protein n=1 Tax=Pseudomonas donghuensis TaxID=1163398 RepID=UPI002E15F300|nr:hypothetical protein VP780_16980 [Pseudomonas donghuensis]
MIFCYYDNYLRAIAKAVPNAYEAERAPTRSFNEWRNQGHRVDIELTFLQRALRSDEIAPTYQAQFDINTKPTLFNRKGRVNTIYMAQLPADAAVYLLEQAEVIAEYEDRLIDGDQTTKPPPPPLEKPS